MGETTYTWTGASAVLDGVAAIVDTTTVGSKNITVTAESKWACPSSPSPESTSQSASKTIKVGAIKTFTAKDASSASNRTVSSGHTLYIINDSSTEWKTGLVKFDVTLDGVSQSDLPSGQPHWILRGGSTVYDGNLVAQEAYANPDSASVFLFSGAPGQTIAINVQSSPVVGVAVSTTNIQSIFDGLNAFLVKQNLPAKVNLAGSFSASRRTVPYYADGSRYGSKITLAGSVSAALVNSGEIKKSLPTGIAGVTVDLYINVSLVDFSVSANALTIDDSKSSRVSGGGTFAISVSTKLGLGLSAGVENAFECGAKIDGTFGFGGSGSIVGVSDGSMYLQYGLSAKAAQPNAVIYVKVGKDITCKLLTVSWDMGTTYNYSGPPIYIIRS